MSFFSRKIGKKEKTTSNHSKKDTYQKHVSDPHNAAHEYGGGARPKTLFLKSVSQQDIEKGDLGGGPGNMQLQTPMLTCSRLSKTLREILHDRDALPYFIQFMESRHAVAYIKFWLDAESFQASSWTRVRSRSQMSMGNSSLQAADDKQQSTASNSSSNNNSTTAEFQSINSNTSVYRRLSAGSHGSDKSASFCDKPLAAENLCCDTSSSSCTNSLQHNAVAAGDTICDNEVCNKQLDSVQSNTNSSEQCGDVQCFSQVSSQSDIDSSSLSGKGNNSHLGNSNNSAHGGSTSKSVSPLRNTASFCDASNAGSSHHHSAPHSTSSQYNMGKETHHISPPASSDQSEHCNISTDVVSNEGNAIDISSGVTTGNIPSEDQVKVGTSSSVIPSSAVSDTKVKTKQDIKDKLLKSIAKDAVSIFSKYIAKDATHPIGVTEDMRAEAIHKICQEDGQVDPQCFSRCQDFAVQVMDERYHSDFLISDYHCKHQIDLLTSSKVYLSDILYNDTAFSYLMQYMEQEGAMPLLQCWLELDNFQQLLVDRQGQYDGMEAQNDAMVIYDKYFSLQATQPLGFNDTIRFEVEANICREEGPLPDCFAKAKKIVVQALDKDYFSGFTRSAIFYKYLQDLISSVQTADIPAFTKKKTTDNDSGSEHSIGNQSTHSEPAGGVSTRNTLLATGIHKALVKMEDNMQIDNALLNPDILWKRPQSGKMSLGKIDELGNYVSEIENEPEGGDRNKIGFFKKKKEKQKSQEEMAAQIAQMIIKDCTSGSQGEFEMPM